MAVLVIASKSQAQSPAVRPPVPGAPVGVTAFVNVNVVPMNSERVLLNQTVLVQSGWITALGPSPEVKVPTNATRIEGQGKSLIPGLADMHVHLGSSSVAERPGLSPDTIAERRLFLLLAQGITTIRNLDYMDRNGLPPFKNIGSPFLSDGPRMLQWRARAAAGELWGPRIYTSGQWGPEQYLTSGADYRRAVRLGKPGPKLRLDSVATYVAAYKAAGYDFLKVREEMPEVLDSVLAAARRLGLSVVGHMPDGASPERVLAAGIRSIEHRAPYAVDEPVRGSGYIPVPGFQDLVALTKRHGVWYTPTIVQSGGAGVIVRSLNAAGVGVLLGTDYPVIPDARVVHFELQLLVQAGLTPYQALATGTRNVATFFGTLDSSGTVAVGKRADLVLLNGNPLQDIRNTMQPAGVLLGGRWLARAAIDRRLADTAAVAGSP